MGYDRDDGGTCGLFIVAMGLMDAQAICHLTPF